MNLLNLFFVVFWGCTCALPFGVSQNSKGLTAQENTTDHVLSPSLSSKTSNIGNSEFTSPERINEMVEFDSSFSDSLTTMDSSTIQNSESEFRYKKYWNGGQHYSIIHLEQDSVALEFLNSANVQFWKRNIQLSEDSFLVVNQRNRQVLDVLPKKTVLNIENGQNLKSLAAIYKNLSKDSIEPNVKFVRGRKSFFNYEGIGPQLEQGMRIFAEHDVNPMICQMLLLIESPSNPKGISVSGAAGHFQLMPSVAKRYGLRVIAPYNKYHAADERYNFYKSAHVAARLVKGYCIPQAKMVCKTLNLEPDLDALWFNLLVLHIYNAGGGTLNHVAKNIHREFKDGNELIVTLWSTRIGRFGNSSQNYSQLCLASYLSYSEFLESKNWVKNDELRF